MIQVCLLGWFLENQSLHGGGGADGMFKDVRKNFIINVLINLFEVICN